ncbi:MAG: Energy-dependent translational throttle protein EttA [Anaerolineales bacterium]|nr:Energy-dependent translational throttle protein EttA [Anaerolineales bacterium]
MIILNLSDITKYYGGQLVLDGLSWSVKKGEKIGLVGPNGAGKSTLFRLIAGVDEPDDGTIYRYPGLSIGYLAQTPRLDPDKTVLAEALSASAEVAALEAELHRLEERMGDARVYADPRKLQRTIEMHEETMEAFEAAGGLNYRSRVESTLRGLGFSEEDFDEPVRSLSGGEKKLVGLAKVLVQRPDLMLLDEPDNHLDLEGKRFLEELIADYPGTVVIISHDRYLLDVVAESIADLEDGDITVWPGNYSEYAYAKEMALAQQQHRYEAQQKEIRRLEQSIARLMSRGYEKFVRRGKSMQKRLEKMEKEEKLDLEPRTMRLRLTSERGSDKVLEVNELTKAFGDDVLFEDLDILIWSGERVGLVGPNGAGKSVLFRILLGKEKPTWGEVKVGPSVTTAQYAQEHETLQMDREIVDEVRSVEPMYLGQAYGFLERFLFDKRMAHKPVRELSGGEKSRLQMAKLMLEEANFLLLDEPTNNLDIPSCEVLEDTLEDYAGTVFVVSHDRYFLDRIVDRIIELEDGRVTEYLGNYTDYVRAKNGGE